MKNFQFYPAAQCMEILQTGARTRLLLATGSCGGNHYWYPAYGDFLHTACVHEANRFFRRLRRTHLRNLAAMRRFCGWFPDAHMGENWCPTFQFIAQGKHNTYRLVCLLNNGGVNYTLAVYSNDVRFGCAAA